MFKPGLFLSHRAAAYEFLWDMSHYAP
jgi:hypothetical protein